MTTPSLLGALLALSTSFTAFGQGLEWVAPITGTQQSEGYGSAVDPAGNVYTIGTFEGTQDFDPGPAEWSFTAAGANDVYATKMDPEGNLLWAYQLGGPSTTHEWGRGIAVAASGDVYLTGAFSGTCDFDPGPGVVELGGSSNGTGFLVKLNTDGSLGWAKRMGVGGAGRGHAVAVGADGNVYCTGFTNGEADFFFGSDVVTVDGNGNWCYIYKVDPTGTSGWVRRTAGNDGQSVVVDGAGNIHVVGMFSNTTDLDPGPDVLPATSAGSSDIHISKLTNTGDLIWAKAIGGSGEDWGLGIAVDGSGNVFCTGHYSTTVDFDPGTGVHERNAIMGVDTYVLKLDPDGTFGWAHAFGGPAASAGSSYDNGYGLTCDADGNVYACGTFTGTIDFDPGSGVYELSAVHQGDIYLVVFDETGALVRATSFGDYSFDTARSVQVNAEGDVTHLTGAFSGAVDFDPGIGEHILTATTSGDAYVLKLGPGSGTSINEPADSPVTLWPNPGTDHFFIQGPFDPYLIDVIDVTGRTVLQQYVTGNIAVVDTEGLRSGSYFVRCGGKGSIRWLKL